MNHDNTTNANHKNMTIVYLFMYLRDSSKYPNLDSDEFACYLFGNDMFQIRSLFTTAVHATGVDPKDLEITPLFITNTAGKYAVSTHLKVAAFEEKAIFTPIDINPTLSIEPEILDTFLNELYNSNNHQELVQTKINQMFPSSSLAFA